MASKDLRQELNCSVCLDIYRDPVTLKCGHSFCLACMLNLLFKQGRYKVYTCPECRQKSRPPLKKNITLSRIVERFHDGQPDEDRNAVFCTFCDFPVLAQKSCQQCETSMCAHHLRKHNETVKHNLLPPTAELQKRRCPVHGKIMEYYCTEDSVCVCVSCRLDGEHRGHQVESLEEASEKKLRPVPEKAKRKREMYEKRIQTLQVRRTRALGVAAEVKERSMAKLQHIKKQLEDLEKMVPIEISRWEMQISQPVTELLQQLEAKKDNLTSQISRFEGLHDLADPLSVLEDQELMKDMCDAEDTIPDDPEFPDLQEDTIFRALHKLSNMVTSAKMWIRKPAEVLLDTYTAADNLWISDNLKSAFRSQIKLPFPKIPERLEYCGVLSLGTFSSWRHYWDVDTSQSKSWKVGMCYPDINRKSCINMIGQGKDSWCLQRCRDNYNMMHDAYHIHLPHKPSSLKFRIYLDYEAGQLSFYELGDATRHLHTFTTTFSKPLHAVLAVFQGSITIGN